MIFLCQNGGMVILRSEGGRVILRSEWWEGNIEIRMVGC